MKQQLQTRNREQQHSTAQLLLDGLIVYSQELGDLGKQLERLLRQHGVRSSLDPTFSLRFH